MDGWTVYLRAALRHHCFIFNRKESKKVYVHKINILGNHITDEEFIRNNLSVDEGDPFTKVNFERSISDIRSRNIFKKVEEIRKRKVETTWLMSVIMFSMKSLWPGGGPCSRGRRRPSRCPRAGSPAASRPAGPGSPGTRTACPPGMCLKDLFTGFVFVICYWCT